MVHQEGAQQQVTPTTLTRLTQQSVDLELDYSQTAARGVHTCTEARWLQLE